MDKNLEMIRSELKHGDMKLIGELVGLNAEYVRQVLRGDRKNKKVIEAAIELIGERAKTALRIKHKIQK